MQWFDKQSHCPMCRAKQDNHRHMIIFGYWRKAHPYAEEDEFPEWLKRQERTELMEQIAEINERTRPL